MDNTLSNKTNNPDNTTHIKDKGWRAWIICFTAFCVNGSVFGIMNTFGILFAAMMDDFENTGQKNLAFRLSWIGSINVGVMKLLSPFSTLIIQICGIRLTGIIGALIGTLGLLSSSFTSHPEVLYVTFGVCVGIGSSLVFISSVTILGHYFDKRIGIANGIGWFGGAVYTISLSFVLKYLLRIGGVPWMLRFLACMFASLLLCTLVWKPQTIDKSNTEIEDDESSKRNSKCINKIKLSLCNGTIWRNKVFTVWVVAVVVAKLGYAVAEVHLVHNSEERFPHSNAEYLVMSIAISSGISRLISGKIADIPILNRIIMLQMTMFCLGVCNACIPLADSFTSLVIVVVFLGLFDGAFVNSLTLLSYDILGVELAGQGTSYLFCLSSFTSVLGPPLAGLTYDRTENYTISFVGAGLALIMGAAILFFALCNKKKGAYSISQDKLETPTDQ